MVQPFAPGPWPARWLALHEREQTSHVLYRFDLCGDKLERRRVLSALTRLSTLSHPHLLRVERFTLEGEHAAWAVTPYTGAQNGPLTLPAHVEAKGGRMSVAEGERAVTHVLEGVRAAHEQGLVHGPIDHERLLVDRFGSIRVELYGYDRLAAGFDRADAELVRDEIRGIVELGYRLITGMEPEEPLIPASRLVRRLDRRVSDWLERGLDPAGGYSTAEEALAALATDGPRVVVGPVRQVLERFRTRRDETAGTR